VSSFQHTDNQRCY